MLQKTAQFLFTLREATLLEGAHRINQRSVHLILSAIAKDTHPVIVGPWLSEVGFEVLYWIPFVRWAVQAYRIDPGRIYVVSRGGVQQWYKGICGTYVEIFDSYSPEEFKRHNDQRVASTKLNKQMAITDFDQEIYAKVASAHAVAKYSLLHPFLMYRLFYAYWNRRKSIGLVERYTSYTPSQAAAEPDPSLRLPKDYVAVKLYFNDPFPRNTENEIFARQLVEQLAKKTPVVLLTTNLTVDDHTETDVQPPHANIINLAFAMKPKKNLGLQTSIMANARCFIGTYGGFSYLAPFYGVPTIALYSEKQRFLPEHLETMQSACRRMETLEQPAAQKSSLQQASRPVREYTAMSTAAYTRLLDFFR